MTIPKTQKAWIYKEYGPKENLHIADVIVPPTGPDQVLIKVQAASLNPLDTMRRLGLFGNFGMRDSELPTVPGYDVAGVVVHVGEDVRKLKVGDRVYGSVSVNATYYPKQYGPLAQFCAVEEKLLAPIPERLSYAEAAGLVSALLTSYQSLALAELKEGQTVLVLGGAGGMGSVAVQLAKNYFKASVVAATCSTPKVEFLKSLGVDVVIDYKKEALADHPTKYDIVLDFVKQGGETLVALKENGKAVVYNGQGQPPVINFSMTASGPDLEKLNPYLQDGTIKPVLDPKGQFKFSEVVEAYGYLETGRATGKIVISPIE